MLQGCDGVKGQTPIYWGPGALDRGYVVGYVVDRLGISGEKLWGKWGVIHRALLPRVGRPGFLIAALLGVRNDA